MGILDTVAGGIDHAVDAVLAPVGDAADRAAEALRTELRQTWHGIFRSPVAPHGTNWNAYTHPELVAMVTAGDPAQVGEQSTELAGLGRDAGECADELALRRAVDDFWRGRAAEAYGGRVDEHRAGVSAAARHAAELADAVAQASAALARAQRQMPEPVDVRSATGFGAMTGAATPFGPVAGAGASWFGTSLLAANRKGEAVEVMQRFEEALRAADPPDPPARPGSPPDAGTGPVARPVAQSSVSTARVPRVRAGAPGPAPGSSHLAVSTGAGETDPSRTGTGTAAPGHGPGAAGPAAPRPADLPSGATATSGAPATSTASATGWATGPDGRTPGGAVGWRALVGSGTRPRLLADADPRFGERRAVAADPARAARSGPAGVGGAVPPARTGRREEDREHRNTMPRQDRLFAVDERVPPPVIGA